MAPTVTRWKRRLRWGFLLLGPAAALAVLGQLTAQPPADRLVHVESFRYGKDPSVIRCNRGDRLHLTFSTADTAHSFFLEEFDVDAKIMPGRRDVAVFRPSDPEAPPLWKREVLLQAEGSGWLGPLASKHTYRCHVWCGPMHGFEQGKLVIRPNTLLHAGLGLMAGMVLAGMVDLWPVLRANRPAPPQASSTAGVDLLRRWPALRRLLRRRGFQYAWIAVTLPLLYVVVLAALFGTQMPGRNLGVMLTWVVWLFMVAAVLTPLGGRAWCTACPLPVLGEVLSRRAITGVRAGSSCGTANRLFGLHLPWPKWLQSDWPRTICFLVLATFSTALVAVPRVTGWVILGLVLAATAMALVWPLRAFCRWLCPVSAFVGLYGRAGKVALRARDLDVCRRCDVRSCQRGSEKGWACPWGLCVGQIDENTDCGLCTECLKTCPYDNVALRWRPFALETVIRGSGEAWLAMVMLVTAVAYCVIHLGHWPLVRDCVNVLDKGNWGPFGVYAAVLWGVALVGLPAVMGLVAAAGKRLARAPQSAAAVLIASTAALIPLGLAVWIALVVPLLSVNATFVLQSLSDPFGWGWDFLGTANTPWHQVWPGAVPWVQVASVLIGLGYGLRAAWRVWLGLVSRPQAALRGTVPLAMLLAGVSTWLVFFFAD